MDPASASLIGFPYDAGGEFSGPVSLRLPPGVAGIAAAVQALAVGAGGSILASNGALFLPCP